MTGSVIVVLALYLLGGVSTSNCDLLLRTLPIVITAAVQVGNPLASPIPKEWPTDLRTALKHFPLDPDLIEYASCPRCCNLTPPDANGQYPSTCTFRETISDPECGAELLQKDRKPIRRYLYQPMGLWLGRMLARPGIEELMDKAWVPPLHRAVGVLKDIWDGNVLQLFSSDGAGEVKDPSTGVREGRLVFSLFVDWFNPFGTGRRGKHISVGAIYLICLNLPPHLRFRAENVYLAGIIPGPAEPRLHEINHFLRPLVDDFLHFFAPGFLCSRTPSSSLGRRFRCLLIPFVADVLAARKTSGFTSHGATFFCSFCRLLKEQICRSFNPQDWPRMDANEHRRIANMWKNAGSTTEREAIAKEYGIRYSELLRLPYWDPSRFTILDSMHNLFLGDFKHHIDDIWTMSAPKKKEATKKTIPHTPEQQGIDLQKLKVFITSGGKDGHARGIRRGYFVAFAKANNVEPSRGTTKAHYSEALLQWVSRIYFFSEPRVYST